MGLHRDLPKVRLQSERRQEHRPVHKQTRPRRQFADKRFSLPRPVGDFEGLLVITWDPRENFYKAYAFGNDFPGALVETGQFEGEALVFRTEFSAGGTTLKLRNVTRVVSPGRLVSEEYIATKDAPESLLVTVEAKKR
jgi:hypothetical protein